ncbi:MAG: hypothetical protein ACR2NO_02865 [Chloroflexota bacterium]
MTETNQTAPPGEIATPPQGASVEIDWNSWRQTFDLPPTALWDVEHLFPALVAGPGHSPPVTESLLLDLLRHEHPDNPADVFQSYMDAGELGAASAVVEVAATTTQTSERLRHRVTERKAELELQLNRQQAEHETLHRRLVTLGRRSLSESVYRQTVADVTELRDVGRLGPALTLLRSGVAALEDEVSTARAFSAGLVLELRARLAEVDGRVRSGAERHLDLADEYLTSGDIDLAHEAALAAQVMLETGALPTDDGEQPLAAERHRLRGPFPTQVQARHIVEWVRRGSTPNVLGVDWAEFARAWLPEEWGPGQEPGDAAFQAIRRLAEAYQSIPNSANSQWPNLLRDLFDLLGRRGQQPGVVKKVTTRVVPPRGEVGFWLGYCAPTLALRGTFLDPSRLPATGLPVLIWHRPRDPKCPRPSSLESFLEIFKLRDRPVLVLADEPVDPEDQRGLRGVAPELALLDETALLRIMLSPSNAPPDQDPTRIRQLHFASAVSSQLPTRQASPFSESGPTSSAMFFGRRDVLRELRDPLGPTVLFGGRRLGKSSILKELERQFTEEDPEHRVAVYVDASNAGITPESVLGLVQAIADGIERYTPVVNGALRPAPFRDRIGRVDSVQNFVTRIRALLREAPGYQFLLLLDEADVLCEYLDVPQAPHLADGQQLGWGLRQIVAEGDGHFDVRLAGFQEINRATFSSNVPFYNFRRGTSGRPLKVFAPDEAIELLTSTLRGLWVEFETRALVERILDFTGRHPALEPFVPPWRPPLRPRDSRLSIARRRSRSVLGI